MALCRGGGSWWRGQGSPVQWYQAGSSAFVQTAVGAYWGIGSGRPWGVEWTGERSCDLPWDFRAEGYRGRHLMLAKPACPSLSCCWGRAFFFRVMFRCSDPKGVGLGVKEETCLPSLLLGTEWGARVCWKCFFCISSVQLEQAQWCPSTQGLGGFVASRGVWRCQCMLRRV